MRYSNLANLHEAAGLTPEQAEQAEVMVRILESNRQRNETKSLYYNAENVVRNIGVAIPDNLLFRCAIGWGTKAVDVPASRSKFERFVFPEEFDRSLFDRAMRLSRFPQRYRKAVPSELTHGISFITVTEGERKPVDIRFYDATRSTCLWDYDEDDVLAGLAVVDFEREKGTSVYYASVVALFFRDSVVTLYYDAEFTRWIVRSIDKNSLGRCNMVALRYGANDIKPMGRSRISHPLISEIDCGLRETIRTEISSEMNAMPQKYVIGSDVNPEAINKTKMYLTEILMMSPNRNGEMPQFGQLPQVQMTPHIEYLHEIARKVSSITSIPLAYLGVSGDSPVSGDAIGASERELILVAEQINDDNALALEDVAHMVMAILERKSVDMLDDNMLGVTAKYADPSYPTISSSTDATMKLCSVVPWLAQCDSVLDMIPGLDPAVKMQLLQEKRDAEAKASILSITE